MTTLTIETIDASETAVGKAVPEHLQDARPFAAVRLGINRYLVANGETDDDLMYRPDDSDIYTVLSRNLEDGWQKVIAEILVLTRHAFNDYVRMHLINVSGDNSTDEYIDLDLFGFKWQMKSDYSDGKIELIVPDRGTVVLSGLDPEQFGKRRDAAVYSLVHAMPELAEQFHQDIDDWATRLAAGATVEPYMG